MFMYCETEQDKLEFCQYLKEQGKEWRDYDDLKDIYGNNTIIILIKIHLMILQKSIIRAIIV